MINECKVCNSPLLTEINELLAEKISAITILSCIADRNTELTLDDINKHLEHFDHQDYKKLKKVEVKFKNKKINEIYSKSVPEIDVLKELKILLKKINLRLDGIIDSGSLGFRDTETQIKEYAVELRKIGKAIVDIESKKVSIEHLEEVNKEALFLLSIIKKILSEILTPEQFNIFIKRLKEEQEMYNSNLARIASRKIREKNSDDFDDNE